MSRRFQIPLQTFTVPTTEKNRNMSDTIILQQPVNLSQSHLIAGCIENAIATIEYPSIWKRKKSVSSPAVLKCTVGCRCQDNITWNYISLRLCDVTVTWCISTSSCQWFNLFIYKPDDINRCHMWQQACTIRNNSKVFYCGWNFRVV